MTYKKGIIILSIFYIFFCSCGYKHNALLRGDNLYFDGETYVYAYGIYEESNYLLCRTDDGSTVYEVVGDKEHNYVVVRSLWNAELYKKESYTFDETKIVSINVGGHDYENFSNDEELIENIVTILSGIPTTVTEDDILERCRKDGIDINVKYENDIVGHFIGYILSYNDQNILYRPSTKTAFKISEEQRRILDRYVD